MSDYYRNDLRPLKLRNDILQYVCNNKSILLCNQQSFPYAKDCFDKKSYLNTILVILHNFGTTRGTTKDSHYVPCESGNSLSLLKMLTFNK